MRDFDVATDDSDPSFPRFSMSLRFPDVIRNAALAALERSAAQGCDIVVFPELCLTPAIQQALGERLRSLGRSHPWLVITGSARTVVGGTRAAHYNRALVFESQGKLVLSHHKLHRYLMDVDQQERYGVREAFGEVNRTEDMEVRPYELEILDTAAGRLAVLICEDLSVEDFVTQLVIKLGLDWLFVPVLDGCQIQNRWPARFGRKYAERGACVVVATSLSLVQQHLLSLAPAPPPPGVGVVILPSPSGSETKILESSLHDHPVILTLR